MAVYAAMVLIIQLIVAYCILYKINRLISYLASIRVAGVSLLLLHPITRARGSRLMSFEIPSLR